MAAVPPNINQARARRVAMKRIEGFAQFGETHRNLACHAAFPLVLTPDLLYQIWANFVPEAPWTAVAHVLLSRLCRLVGYEMYEMDITDRNLLLRELKEQFGQERLNELGEFLLDYVAQRLTGDDPDTQDLAQAQEWTALAYTKPDEAAHKLTETLSQRMKQKDVAEVFRIALLVETFAEPLLEAGYEQLLVYARSLDNFARGNQDTTAELGKLDVSKRRIRVAAISLKFPSQVLDRYAILMNNRVKELHHRRKKRFRNSEIKIPKKCSSPLPPSTKILEVFDHETSERYRLLMVALSQSKSLQGATKLSGFQSLETEEDLQKIRDKFRKMRSEEATKRPRENSYS